MEKNSKQKVGIIGGGIMGISLGYFLSKQGASVTIYEASPVLGGLAGPLVLEDGTAVDRFYHACLSSDSHLSNLWRRVLKAKFDGGFDNVPATWIWSRLVRMKSTREGANQKEMAGHLIGGYITLIKALTEKILAVGGEVLLKTAVKEIVLENG